MDPQGSSGPPLGTTVLLCFKLISQQISHLTFVSNTINLNSTDTATKIRKMLEMSLTNLICQQQINGFKNTNRDYQ